MRLSDIRAGVVLLEGFQELEFWYPVLRFREEGIPVSVIGADPQQTTFSQLGYPVVPETSFAQVDPGCNVLVIPGTHVAPSAASAAAVVALVQGSRQSGATIAATGSAVRLLADAGLLRGVRVAAAPALAEHVVAQGGVVSETAACSDRGIVTARGVDDLPEFFKALLGVKA